MLEKEAPFAETKLLIEVLSNQGLHNACALHVTAVLY